MCCGFGMPFRGLRRRFGTPGGSFFGTFSEAVLGHAETVRAPLLHEKMDAPVCTLFPSFRPPTPGGRKFFYGRMMTHYSGAMFMLENPSQIRFPSDC